MAGVLSCAAGHLRSTFRPASIVVTTLSRPSLFPTGPRASTIPRLIHTEVAPSTQFPPWFRDQIRALVKEAVDTEMKQTRDRCEHLCTKLIALEELTATRHAESMVTYVKAEQRIAKISFRIGVTMVGLAAASQYQGEIGKAIIHVLGVPSPPSREEVAATVKKELQSAKTDIETDISEMVKVVCAHHFLEEEKKKSRNE